MDQRKSAKKELIGSFGMEENSHPFDEPPSVDGLDSSNYEPDEYNCSKRFIQSVIVFFK